MKRLVVLAALPLLLALPACAGAGVTASGTGSVRGTVLLGPTCPVETESSPCPEQPAEGVEVQALRDGVVAATAVSDEHGDFTMRLDAGAYLIKAVARPDGPGMFAKPTRVIVPEGATVDVTVLLDTGIRAPTGSENG